MQEIKSIYTNLLTDSRIDMKSADLVIIEISTNWSAIRMLEVHMLLVLLVINQV